MGKVFGIWHVKQHKDKEVSSYKQQRSTSVRSEYQDIGSYDKFWIISYWNAETYRKHKGTAIYFRSIEKERKRNRNNKKVAKAFCLDLTKLELNLCSSKSSAAIKEGAVDLEASYDIDWQRKSSGRAYNSRSGDGVLIGTESEKILSYGT